MTESHKQENLNYGDSDQSDGNGSIFTQISLPSCRIEVPSNEIFFKDIGGGKHKEVQAKDIKKNDYLCVLRDDEHATEMVLEEVKRVSKKLPAGSVRKGIIIVNNVLMRHQ